MEMPDATNFFWSETCFRQVLDFFMLKICRRLCHRHRRICNRQDKSI